MKQNMTGVAGDNIGTQTEVINYLKFDGATHYQYCHFINIDRDYLEIQHDVVKVWGELDRDFKAPYYPHVSIGWDNNPRFQGLRLPVIFSPPVLYSTVTPSKYLGDTFVIKTRIVKRQ